MTKNLICKCFEKKPHFLRHKIKMMQKCKKVLIKFVWVIPKSHDDLQKNKNLFIFSSAPMPCGGVLFKNAFFGFFCIHYRKLNILKIFDYQRHVATCSLNKRLLRFVLYCRCNYLGSIYSNVLVTRRWNSFT